MPAPTLLDDIATAIDALARVSTDAASYRVLDDPTLLELTRLASVERRLVEAHAALLAGEVAHRSAPGRGHAGLAQRTGYRTAEELVRVSTRSTAREASTTVRVGRLLRDAASAPDPITGEPAVPSQPWLQPVATAIISGSLPIASADAIRTGLGEPSAGVTVAALTDAAARLCTEATALDADRIFRRARELRDELDAAGIADRERERRDGRSLRFVRQADGMSRLTWLLDPESAAVAAELYDRATSPRRGGPRFVPAEQQKADRILADTRSTEQLASDVFLELLRQGAAAGSAHLLGTGAPSVRVLVTADALHAREGRGRLEGQPDPVSIETVERLACSGTMTPIVFDSAGQPLDLGREQRLFTRRQRIALAARDGGCRFPGCERPPSWTEAHHVQHWRRDNGSTDVAAGILLCRHHHLLLHNNHWEISRQAGNYWLVPPPDLDPGRVPILMPSKSAAVRELLRGRAG